MLKKLLLTPIVALTMLSACSTTQPLQPIEFDRPSPVKPLALPSPVLSQEVEFTVLPDGTIHLSPEEFEDLNENLTGYLEWIREARRQLDYYVEGLTSDADTQ